jgi:prepilin-type N-terminal cleavage/methylation domain-containing protein
MMGSQKSQQGFTLIELILVLAFLGSLMLLASASMIQAINIYNKGIAIKQINQAGRSLIEDINRLSSAGSEIDIIDNGKAGCLRIGFTNEDSRVFLWNSTEAGKGTTTPAAGAATWKIGGEDISLVQSTQEADTSNYCILPGDTTPDLLAADMSQVLTPQVRVLSVDITEPAGGDPTLKKIAFWIGTGTLQGVQTVLFDPDPAARSWSCPGGSLGEYCAVSKFETVIYVPNEGKSE